MRIRILRDVKTTGYNKKISLRDMSEKSVVSPERTANFSTEFIHNRKGSSGQSQSTVNHNETQTTKIKITFFERHKNILPLVTMGILVIFVINIFAVIVKTGFLKEDLSYSAYEGYQSLVEGGENIFQTNFSEALNSFEKAEAQFAAIEKDLWFLKDENSLGGLSDSKLSDGGRVLSIGENLSSAGKEFAYGLVGIKDAVNLLVKDLNKPSDSVPEFEKVEKQPAMTDALDIAVKHFNEAEIYVQSASFLLKKVNPSLYPTEYAPKVQEAIKKLDLLNNYLNDINQIFPPILKLLGHDEQHTYLVLFHNSYELRPMMGFIGSYAVVDVNNGYVKKLEIKDVYELDGQFHEQVEGVPDEIKEIAGTLKMRDSNYSPDARISLKNAAWFYQKQGGKSVDSVISIDQNVLGKILYITGPIQIDGLEAPITAENYDFIVSYIVESKLYGADKPKQILNELFSKISAKLKEQQYQAKVIELFLTLAKNKEILAYSKDESIQKLVEKVGLEGSLQNWGEKGDGLQIVRTSIGGNKSDKYIKHNYTHTSYISASGQITDKVEIELQHTWHQGVLNEWDRTVASFGLEGMNDTVKDILGRGINRSGVRVYIPNGATLIDVQGLPVLSVAEKTDKDLGRQYFYFELEVEPQQSRQISLEYKLPFKLDTNMADTYKFYYDSQIGARNVKLSKIIRGDVGLKNYRNYPEQELNAAQTLEYTLNGTVKHYLSGIWGR